MLHNIAMGAQLVDDWHDIEIDRLLKVPSFGVALIDTFDGNKKKARREVSRMVKGYKDRAHEISGVGYISQGLFVSAVDWFKRASNYTLKQAKNSRVPQIRSRFGKYVERNLGIRERDFQQGLFD